MPKSKTFSMAEEANRRHTRDRHAIKRANREARKCMPHQIVSCTICNPATQTRTAVLATPRKPDHWRCERGHQNDADIRRCYIGWCDGQRSW